MKRLNTSSPAATRRTLNRIINEVYNGSLGTKEANCIVSACNVVLQAYKTIELEAKVNEIEEVLGDLDG